MENLLDKTEGTSAGEQLEPAATASAATSISTLVTSRDLAAGASASLPSTLHALDGRMLAKAYNTDSAEKCQALRLSELCNPLSAFKQQGRTGPDQPQILLEGVCRTSPV